MGAQPLKAPSREEHKKVRSDLLSPSKCSPLKLDPNRGHHAQTGGYRRARSSLWTRAVLAS